ncbi:MAG: hypothetical protein Q7S58_17280 [Candidatus Binatus sp.]|uniref:TolB family protein n=1 Tax=Candidatus Binatus sp. TaxID=2811406 RepID=UPI002726237B|nr:hypothetical protein [Candidatus Binatus sp.]MDO8434154.1 hypothetical protein [Candidatus Binatus sp.]
MRSEGWARALVAVAAMMLGIAACAGADDRLSIDPMRRIQPPQFANPQRVTILGFSEDAMEPFITRNGKHLFFNNSNSPSVNTNLFQATRIDDLTFQFDGEIGGVNTAALDAVASMDLAGNFYFVSTRSYDSTASTIYRGAFASGDVTGVDLAPGVSLQRPGIVDFDAEISADGNTLYFSEGRFSGGPVPDTAKILIAKRTESGFVRPRNAKAITRRINTPTLNYAADISASELEIFFTRFDPGGPAIYTASRASKTKPFGKPQKIKAITGFAEAPSISPDGKSLYYHKNEGGIFVIYRVTRP